MHKIATRVTSGCTAIGCHRHRGVVMPQREGASWQTQIAFHMHSVLLFLWGPCVSLQVFGVICLPRVLANVRAANSHMLSPSQCLICPISNLILKSTVKIPLQHYMAFAHLPSSWYISPE